MKKTFIVLSQRDSYDRCFLGVCKSCPFGAVLGLQTNADKTWLRLPINYGKYYTLTLPKVTPTAQRPKLIAPNSPANGKQLCYASSENG
jgi:hypothetical protein